MGKSSSKQVDQTNVKSDEFQSGGVHVLEYHGPSAGYAFLVFLGFAALAGIVFYAYKRCSRRQVKRALRRAGLPWPAATSATSPTIRTAETGAAMSPMATFSAQMSPAPPSLPIANPLMQAMAAAAMMSQRRDQLWSSPPPPEDDRWYEFPAEPRTSSGRRTTAGPSRRETMNFPTTRCTSSGAGHHGGQSANHAVVAATGGPHEQLSTDAAIQILRVAVDAAAGGPRRAVEKRRRGHAVIPAVVPEGELDADPFCDTEVAT